jgi:hypothetical protein
MGGLHKRSGPAACDEHDGRALEQHLSERRYTMANSLTHDPARALPLYRDGFSAGRDVGLAIALAAITAERVHQERLARDPDARSPACRVYADGVLLALAKVMARRFRQ